MYFTGTRTTAAAVLFHLIFHFIAFIFFNVFIFVVFITVCTRNSPAETANEVEWVVLLNFDLFIYVFVVTCTARANDRSINRGTIRVLLYGTNEISPIASIPIASYITEAILRALAKNGYMPRYSIA